jgi:hypothetical protein
MLVCAKQAGGDYCGDGKGQHADVVYSSNNINQSECACLVSAIAPLLTTTLPAIGVLHACFFT